VYLSEKPNVTNDESEIGKLIWEQTELHYNWDESNYRETVIVQETPEILLQNGSLYVHVFVTKEGFSHLPNSKDYNPLASFHASHRK
jgi:hypothetical protein